MVKNPLEIQRKILEKIASSNTSNLRFGLPAVAVSSIADQYFCEKKVELKYIRGEEFTTEEIEIGKLGHEALAADAIRKERSEIWNEIMSGKPVRVLELFLIGEYEGAIIVGSADEVIFHSARPILLVEYKFSRKPIPFKHHHTQARLYCFLLDSLGLDTSELKYAIVIAPLNSSGNERLRKVSLDILRNPKLDKLKIGIENGIVNVYVNKYNRAEAEEELKWAIPFWKAEREAIPTKKEGKCKACEFRNVCPENLAK